MPALRLIRQVAPSDVLAVTICSLEVLQETSDAITIVPFLGNIVGAALGIARTVERLRGDKDRFVRLARRVSELSRHIDESVAADPEAIDDNPKVNLIELQTLFTRIREDVETYSRRSSLSRFFLQSSIADLIDDRMDQLDSVWRAFDTACLIALRTKMERQALYDDRSQLRLFRWSDLRCLRVRGTYSVSGHVVGHEWEGKWDGRAVVIRTVRERPETHWRESVVTYYPDIHHPYVAQVIGYSHPALSERFYVMDAGIIPLMTQFRGTDILSRLFQWLQHVVDYQDAFHYLEGRNFPVNECHSHDRCLPSAMLNEEGRLIVDAVDFCNANLGCFQSCLRTLYDEECGTLSPGKDYASDDDVTLSASMLLSQLRSYLDTKKKSNTLELDSFLQSDLSKIWSSHQFQGEINGKWGDYGYIERNGSREVFIRLGNIYDVVTPTGKLSTFLLRRSEGCDWKPAVDYFWPQGGARHVFELKNSQERVEEIAAVRTLPDDFEYHEFFWDCAEDIACEHDLHVHDVILFEESFHYAGAIIYDVMRDSEDAFEDATLPPQVTELPALIYFHQLPLLPSGEVTVPWGYWSLDPEPTPGPWPIFELPGLELTCRLRSNYARLSAFEGEILVYLNRLRRGQNRWHATPPPAADGRGHLEELH